MCAPALRRFIRSRVPDALVEDTLQDTFLRAYRSRMRFDAARPPLPWLMRIAGRACWETLRVLPAEFPVASADNGIVCSRDDPHQHFERRLRVEAISGALSDLSSRHQRLLRAWELEDDGSYLVLAAQEGISTKALKSALFRARAAFRARYTALAERSGVAAVLAWRPFRHRHRFDRDWRGLAGFGPVAEAAFASMAATLVTVALVLTPTPRASGGTAEAAFVPNAAATAYWLPANVHLGVSVAPQEPPPAVDLQSGSGGTHGLIGGVSTPETGPLAARGEVDLGVDSNASDATVTLGLDEPTGSLSVVQGVEVRCNTEIRGLACDAARRTPLAR